MDIREYAPLCVFAYDRRDKLENCLKALNCSPLAGYTDLYIFSDGAKEGRGGDKVEEVRSYIDSFAAHNSFRNVIVKKSEKNKGLAKSIIGGVSSVIERYGRVITVEDDLLVRPDFLDYMNSALDYYEDCREIWSISGYTFPMKAFRNYEYDVYLSYRASSWGWATWKDRWETVDWEVRDYDAFMKDEERQKKFNRGGNDLVPMLKNQMEGRIDSWAIRWCYCQSMQDRYTVYPVRTFVKNDGFDGSGTNSGTGGEYKTEVSNEALDITFGRYKIDRRIAREFYLKYSDTLKKKILRNLSVKKIKARLFGK